jgi:imidazolonepropionase
MSLLIRNARVVQGGGAPTLPRADVRVEGDRITAVEPAAENQSVDEVIDAGGRVLMPAFVDPHTHALSAGDRLDEFELRLKGATYLELLAAGGGILATVRATRAASESELVENLSRRLNIMLREGATTIEVKSGYGLTTKDELKMLRAIAAAAKSFPGTIVPTALIGHAIDKEQANFIDTVVNETMPAVHDEFPGIAIDAYCEQGVWSIADCRRLFERAIKLGHPVRLHADQFNSLGGIDLAIELGAMCVDHLEASSEKDLEKLARSPVFGVMLPASGFLVDGRYAHARAFLDAGGKLALASNCNPGTTSGSSMPFVIALAVHQLKLSVDEAIAATTANAAKLLNFPDRGRIAPGLRADLILLRHRDERYLGFEVGGNPVDVVICGGGIIS